MTMRMMMMRMRMTMTMTMNKKKMMMTMTMIIIITIVIIVIIIIMIVMMNYSYFISITIIILPTIWCYRRSQLQPWNLSATAELPKEAAGGSAQGQVFGPWVPFQWRGLAGSWFLSTYHFNGDTSNIKLNIKQHQRAMFLRVWHFCNQSRKETMWCGFRSMRCLKTRRPLGPTEAMSCGCASLVHGPHHAVGLPGDDDFWDRPNWDNF